MFCERGYVFQERGYIFGTCSLRGDTRSLCERVCVMCYKRHGSVVHVCIHCVRGSVL